jgi:fido (protein-threonine AMPylation protein)
MKFNYPPGSTPLDQDEIAGLIPRHITTQEELNAWEERNIIEAEPWAFKQKDILSIAFIKKLHKRMFGKTWKWAGEFRTSEKI